MYYTTQNGYNILITYPFLLPRVTIFVDIRSRKFVPLTTVCNLNKNLEQQYWPNSCSRITVGDQRLTAKQIGKAMQKATETTDFNKTILWVDDEEIALDVWSLMLQKLGYAVLQARNGYEALEIFEKNKDRISLVLLDMRMPGMNGCEVYDRLKEIRPETKIILVSGYIDQHIIDELSRRDFNGYMGKPFRLKELSKKVEEVLAQP